MEHPRRFRRLTSFQTIILGFALVILSGSLLLMLPFSSRSGEVTGFLDALFTAVSAVCVTGLVVFDTATYWSFFGQLVIMLLIQIGGLGVVTATGAIVILTGKKIGLVQRSVMQEALSAHKVGGVVRLTGFIVKATFLIEALGALMMAPVFCKDFGIGKGLWYACFHAVSAFCNAGFDLMGEGQPFSSLTAYAANPVVNFAIIFLIVVGGIGFMTWEDMWSHRHHFRKYRMQSKVILCVTALLILLPAMYFYFIEFSHLSGGERIWSALFQSVTPRTAGFNTVDLTALRETGQGLLIVLMLIGGSPGSTAGGMKTTTLAVLLTSALSVFQRKDHPHLFQRRVTDETVKYAATVLQMYLVLCLTGGMVISVVEGLPLLDCLFETASAIGTVGLSLGLTPELGTCSRIILIFLMFIGRVGGLTLIFAALSGSRPNISRFPEEKITVG